MKTGDRGGLVLRKMKNISESVHNVTLGGVLPEFEWNFKEFKEGIVLLKNVLKHHQTVDTPQGHFRLVGNYFGCLSTNF